MSEALNQNLFNVLENYLNGTEPGITCATLQAICDDEHHGGKSALALYQKAKLSKENFKKLHQRLQTQSTTFYPRYSLYDWIQSLSQRDCGHRQLEDFHYILQQITPHETYTTELSIATLITALGGIDLFLVPAHMQAVEAAIHRLTPLVINFLKTTFSVLKNIQVVLFSYTALCVPLQLYHSLYYDTFRSPEKRFQKWLAGTLPPALSLISYYLCYTANGVFTPTATLLFIVSSLVPVAHSWYNRSQLKPIGEPPSEDAPIDVKRDYIRQVERLERTKETIRVNLGASVLTSISVILWCLLPPSFFVTIASVLFINLVGFTQSAMLNHTHKKGAEKLQRELRTESGEARDKAFQALNSENESLKAENKALKQQLQFFSPTSPSKASAETEIQSPVP